MAFIVPIDRISRLTGAVVSCPIVGARAVSYGAFIVPGLIKLTILTQSVSDGS